LNTQEIDVAAHLYHKKVQIVTASAGGGVERAEWLMNECADGDTIVTFSSRGSF
jgi:L-aminopeptidase/D-esterase-like protein